MGAYYAPTLTANKKHQEMYNDKLTIGEPFRVSSYDIGSNGAKLMEHSYIGNLLVAHTLRLIEDNPSNLIWLCDYSENETFNWETVTAVETNEMEYSTRFLGESGFIINHTTNEYISITAYKRHFAKQSNDWAISPLPILTNSEGGSSGGGDLHNDEQPLRGLWYNHLISYTRKLGDFKRFKNVTADVIIIED